MLETYYFTATVEKQQRIRAAAQIQLAPLTDSVGELRFFEDRDHGVDLIRTQQDQADVSAYQHAVLFEMALTPGFIASCMNDPATGRVSAGVGEMLAAVGRGSAFTRWDGVSAGVLVLDEIAEHAGGHDGMTHRYVLRCPLLGDNLCARLLEACRKLTLVGGVPGVPR
jgi:hypothetical protein